MTILTLKQIIDINHRIGPYIHNTPVHTSTTLNSISGGNCKLYFKCENLQKTGSFKVRGALNAVMKSDKSDGIITHSSGNHGQAVAWAASILNKACIVVVPTETPPNKKKAIESYGAQLVECGSPENRVSKCDELMEKNPG